VVLQYVSGAIIYKKFSLETATSFLLADLSLHGRSHGFTEAGGDILLYNTKLEIFFFVIKNIIHNYEEGCTNFTKM
jgi:hypothetical protein